MRHNIPRIGIGTGGLGGNFTPDYSRDQETISAFQLSIEHGMKFIDTAENYGGGHTEELVGKAIRGKRDGLTIASKFSPDKISKNDIAKALEGSLKRLNIDCLDIYQTHWPSNPDRFKEVLDAMYELIQKGKTRYIGLCNPTMEQLAFACDYLTDNTFFSVQTEYNPFERSAEDTYIKFTEENSMYFIGYSPFLRGRMSVQKFEENVSFNFLKEKYSASTHTLILAWLARKQNVVIIPRSINQLKIAHNARALNLHLESHDIEVLSEVFTPPITLIPTKLIDVLTADDRKVYKTLEEALENREEMTPSPSALATEFKSGYMPKPIKVRKLDNGRYGLVEGRLKYWAWVIAFEGQRNINAILEE